MFNPGIIGFVLAFIVVVIFLYSRFIVLKKNTKDAWSQMDHLLKERLSMVPILIEKAEEYTQHERDVLVNIMIARNMVEASYSLEDKAEAEKEMTDSLSMLFAVAEKYPDLKADQKFLSLKKELSGIEKKISNARKLYNDTVQKYNKKIEMFPNNLLASLFKFEKAEYFNLPDKATKSI